MNLLIKKRLSKKAAQISKLEETIICLIIQSIEKEGSVKHLQTEFLNQMNLSRELQNQVNTLNSKIENIQNQNNQLDVQVAQSRNVKDDCILLFRNRCIQIENLFGKFLTEFIENHKSNQERILNLLSKILHQFNS
jgi:cell division protein FtsL